MSIVYRAHDPQIRRTLAVKVLQPHIARDPPARRQFLTEARAAGGLTHPNIVTVFDVGEAEGTPFLAMELLQGETLASRVQRTGALALTEVLQIGMRVAEALDYAHRRGIVHRDIKPGNLMCVDGPARVKIMDFGVAHLKGDTDGIDSDAFDTVGTPQYMAPEQILGRDLDGRADLYALGVLLFWLLSGDLPYAADTTEGVLERILNNKPRRLVPTSPQTPKALIEAVRALLNKDPEQRYQSGQELARDLRVIEREYIEREGGWAQRFFALRVQWPLIMGVLVTLLMVTGGWAVYLRQARAINTLAYDNGMTVSRMVARETAEDLLLEDHIALQTVVDYLQNNRSMSSLTVIDRSGTVVASTDRGLVGKQAPPVAGRLVSTREDQSVYRQAHDERADLLRFDTPVLFQDQRIGRVRMGMSTARIEAAARTTFSALLALLLASVAGVLVGAHLLARRLTPPLRTLREGLAELAAGNFAARLRNRRKDDFRALFAAFNALAETLELRFGQRSGRAGEDEGQMPQDRDTTVVLDDRTDQR